MGRHTPPPETIIAEMTAIAAMSGGIAARAEAMLEPLRRLTHFDAGRITVFDPQDRLHPSLVSLGYDERVEGYLHGPEIIDDIELLGMDRDRPPMRLVDMPLPAEEVPLWGEYLHPAGYREGIAAPLFTPDRRYVGLFASVTESGTPPTDATRDVLHQLARLIAHAIDPIRTITALANLVTDAIAGVILAQDGTTVALPGVPGHRMLRVGSPILAEAAACYGDGDSRATFLAPCRAPDPPGYTKVTMLACPDQLPHRLSAVVLLSPPGNLRQLSHREMTVLGMLIEGWTGPRIAARLHIPAFAVQGALETARAKLGAPTPAAAVMRAADQGLYLPPNIVATASTPPHGRGQI